MQQLKRHKGKQFTWKNAAEDSFQKIKTELCEAPVLGMHTQKGMYVSNTDASVVAISGILHQEKEWNGKAIMRPITYGSKVLSDTEMKYGSPKAEMFAVVTFVENIDHNWERAIQATSRKQSTQLVRNVLNGPELHREMDSAPGWLRHDYRAQNKGKPSERRQFEQKDGVLREAGAKGGRQAGDQRWLLIYGQGEV